MKKIAGSFLFVIALSMVMNACRKDDNDDSNPGLGGTGANQVNTTITGIVTDESNQPVTGVQVIAYGNVTTTDANGIFVLKGDVDKKRCVIEFSKQGYIKRLHAIIPSSAVNYVRIMLQEEPFAQSIMTANGGTVNLGSGGSAVFPPNAFVLNGTTTPYIGEVLVYAEHISPADPNFSMLIPGGDLLGEDAIGTDVTLYSYGMTGVVLRGSGGEALQLESSAQATLTFPIASSQLATAPQSIPLWYYDETENLWKEEGQATRVGNNYVGNVAHFSWWNCDYSGPTATVKGRVVDCEGIPLANITVTVNGNYTLMTDQNGYYSQWVPSGMALTFQVLPQATILIGSQIENVAPLLAGQNFIIPDLEVPCGSRINGTLTGCNSEPTEGCIMLFDNGNPVYQVYSPDGIFSAMLIPNTNYTLQITSLEGSLNQTAVSPDAGNTNNLGQIHLCNNNEGGPNSYVINGDGYNNLLINITGYTSNYAEYYPNSNSTSCLVEGQSVLGMNGSTINLNFDGNQPFTVNLSDSSTIGVGLFFGLNLPSNGFYHPELGISPFIFTVTEYGNVGDSVKGTFYGHLISQWTQNPVSINNGKFAFLRTQ